LQYLYSIYLKNKKSRLNSFKDRLEALNPTGVLKRGYAIATKDEKIISSSEQVEENDILKLSWYDGSVISRVEEVE